MLFFHPDNADRVKRRDDALEEQRKKDAEAAANRFGTVHAPPWCDDEEICVGDSRCIYNPCPDCEIEKFLLLERESLQLDKYAEVDAALERDEQELGHLVIVRGRRHRMSS